MERYEKKHLIFIRRILEFVEEAILATFFDALTSVRTREVGTRRDFTLRCSLCSPSLGRVKRTALFHHSAKVLPSPSSCEEEEEGVTFATLLEIEPLKEARLGTPLDGVSFCDHALVFQMFHGSYRGLCTFVFPMKIFTLPTQ